MRETLIWLLGQKIHWRSDWLPTPVFLGFPGGSDGRRICLQCGEPGFHPWVGKTWRRAWQATGHGVTKRHDWGTFTFLLYRWQKLTFGPFRKKIFFSTPTNSYWRDFPGVQWLRLHTPNSGGLGLIPGRGTRSHIRKSLHAGAKRPKRTH